jgi:hypothetical protein
MCAAGATAPSCSGFTIDQIGGIMCVCRSHPPPDTERPLHSRKIHQGALGGQKAGRGIFRALPEGPLPNGSRELAPPAIAKYRVHDEAARRAGRSRWLIAAGNVASTNRSRSRAVARSMVDVEDRAWSGLNHRQGAAGPCALNVHLISCKARRHRRGAGRIGRPSNVILGGAQIVDVAVGVVRAELAVFDLAGPLWRGPRI